ESAIRITAIAPDSRMRSKACCLASSAESPRTLGSIWIDGVPAVLATPVRSWLVCDPRSLAYKGSKREALFNELGDRDCSQSALPPRIRVAEAIVKGQKKALIRQNVSGG